MSSEDKQNPEGAKDALDGFTPDEQARIKQLRGKSYKELNHEYSKITAKVAEAKKQAGAEVNLEKVTCLDCDKEEVLNVLQKMNAEASILAHVRGEKRKAIGILNTMHNERDDDDVSNERVQNKQGASTTNQVKDFGSAVTESEEFLAAHESVGSWASRGFSTNIENGTDMILNASFATSSGWAPQVLRSGRVVLSEQKPVELIDILPRIPVGAGGLKYMLETTYTNNTAPKGEGAALGENALALTEQEASARKIGATIPVTDEQLAYVPGARAYLNSRLPTMVRQRLSEQVLNGNGTAPNFNGLTNVNGINTEAKTNAKDLLDVFLNARTAIQKNAFAEPDAVLVSPDVLNMIMKEQDSQGRYLLNGPGSGDNPSLWGVRLVVNNSLAANTAFMGDFASGCALIVAGDLQVEVGYTGTQFAQNVQTIRATMYANVATFRPKAFCSITGLNT